MKRISFLLIAVSMLMLASCSKTDNSYPLTPAGSTDTLSAGWTLLASPASSGGISDISFTDPLHGYATGATGIYKSADGGNTWTTLSTATNYFAIGAIDASACFLNGTNTVINTLDRTATSASTYTSASGFSKCFFPVPNVCYAVTPNAVWKSYNNGAFFSLQYSFPSTYTGTPAINFTDESEGFLARGNALYATYDAGSSWTLAAITDGEVKAVLDRNSSAIYYATATTLYKSGNGGSSWSQVLQYPSSQFADIVFVNSSVMYLSAGPAVYKSSDGGNTWRKIVALGPGKSISALSFNDEFHGWACGNFGILKFSN